MAVTLFSEGAYLGFAVQSALGSAAAPTAFLKVVTLEYEDQQDLADYSDGNVFDITTMPKRSFGVRIKGRCLAYMSEGSRLIAHAMGAASDSISGGSDPYTHTITLKGQQPYTTFEVGYYMNAAGTIQGVRRVSDCKIDKLTVQGTAGGEVFVDFEIVGLTVDTSQSAASVSFTDAVAHGPLMFHQASFTLTGPSDAATLAAQIRDFKITLDRNVEVITGPNSLTGIALFDRRRRVDVTFNVYWSSNDIEQITYYGSSSGTAPSATLVTAAFVATIQANASPLHNWELTTNGVFTMAQPKLSPQAMGAGIVQVNMRGRKVSSTMPISVICKTADSSAYAA